MNAGDTTINRRMQYHAGYALVEVLVESIVAAGRGLSRGFAAIAAVAASGPRRATNWSA